MSEVEHIYMCECGEVLITVESKADCSRCAKPMEVMGWAETKTIGEGGAGSGQR